MQRPWARKYRYCLSGWITGFSSAAEGWRALLAKCSNRFLVVRGENRQALITHRSLQYRMGDRLQTHVDRQLGPLHRLGGIREQFGGKVRYGLVELGGGHRVVDQSDLHSVWSEQQVPRQQVFLRLGKAEQLGPDH